MSDFYTMSQSLELRLTPVLSPIAWSTEGPMSENIGLNWKKACQAHLSMHAET